MSIEKKIFFVIAFLSLLISVKGCATTLPAQTAPKWTTVNGIWQVKDGLLIQPSARAIAWNFHELSNYNSVLSISPIGEFVSFQCTININIPGDDTIAEFMLPFAVADQKLYSYCNFLAFKLTGAHKKINMVSLIKSERKDQSKPFTVKNNYTLTQISQSRCSLKYNSTLVCLIKIRGDMAEFSVNGKKLLEGPVSGNISGKLGFAVRNAQAAIDSVIITRGGEILLTDDFSSDTLYVPTVKVRRLPR